MPEPNRGAADLLNAPNTLTMLRLVLALVFFVFIPLAHQTRNYTLWYVLALAIFLLAIFTDWLDGFLARRWHQETAFGRVADPFVDKLLICGAFILFAIYHKEEADAAGAVKYLVNVTPWMVVIVVGRECLISALRGYAESRNVKFGANVWGKQKMVFQSMAVGALLLHHGMLNTHFAYAVATAALLWLAVGWTVLSGILYVVRAGRVLGNEPETRK